MNFLLSILTSCWVLPEHAVADLNYPFQEATKHRDKEYANTAFDRDDALFLPLCLLLVRIVGRVHIVDREGTDSVDLDDRVTLRPGKVRHLAGDKGIGAG